MSNERVIIGCLSDPRDPERQTRHRRWRWVPGTMATPEHPYTEQQCIRCGRYRSDVVVVVGSRAATDPQDRVAARAKADPNYRVMLMEDASIAARQEIGSREGSRNP